MILLFIIINIFSIIFIDGVDLIFERYTVRNTICEMNAIN